MYSPTADALDGLVRAQRPKSPSPKFFNSIRLHPCGTIVISRATPLPRP